MTMSLLVTYFVIIVIFIIIVSIILIAKEVTSDIDDDYEIIISLSSIPDREKRLIKCIDSILEQNLVPDKINVNLCHTYKRFPTKRYNMKYLEKYRNNKKVLINYSTDYGPITKLLGLTDNYKIKKNSIIMLVDDDLMYKPDTITNLFNSYKANPDNAYSYYTYYNKTNECMVGQASDVFVINPKYLNDIKTFYDNCITYDKRLFYHDDLVISKYLGTNKCKIKMIKPSPNSNYDNQQPNALHQLKLLEFDNARNILNQIKIPSFF